MFPRQFAVVGAALMLSLFAVACGDEDVSGSGSGELAPAQPDDQGQGGSVEINVSGTVGKPTFEVTESVPAGVVEITMTNEAKGGEVDGQLIRAEGDQSAEDVQAELANAVEGKPVADWFVAAGGVGTVPTGESDTVTQVLEPGRYYVAPGDSASAPTLAAFEVTGEGGGELPETDATVTSTEYEFSAEGLAAGENAVLFDNAGEEWHHFIAAPLREGATIEDAQKFFETEGEGGGPPPIAFASSLDTTVMNPGVSQIWNVDLKPGTYAFVCFISDREGGPPHIAQGMISEVTVE